MGVPRGRDGCAARMRLEEAYRADETDPRHSLVRRERAPLDQHVRGGLVFKAQRLVYHSSLGWRVMHEKKEVWESLRSNKEEEEVPGGRGGSTPQPRPARTRSS